MTDTPNLGLPFIEAAQAQKHVPHNEALRVLDTLVQLSVEASDLTSPPPTPAEGQRWIVAAGATGAWSGHDNALAVWQDAAWVFLAPSPGWTAYDTGASRLLAFSGSTWEDAAGDLASLQNMTLLGVGTMADATNPFSAKLNNALWTARTAGEGGDGDLRYKMNKETAGDTVSLLMQTNFSGRAEVGLTGDDDFHFKVSADGTTWNDSLVLAAATGNVTTPRVLAVSNTTASTAVTNGSAVFAGGVGIGGALNVGADVKATVGSQTLSFSTGVGNVGTIEPAINATGGALIIGPNGSNNAASNYAFNRVVSFASGGMVWQSWKSVASADPVAADFGIGCGATLGQIIIKTAGVVTIPTALASTSTTTGALTIVGGVGVGGALNVGGGVGFNGSASIAKPTISGSRGGNAALASLLTALASYGLITDSTT